MLPDEYYEVTDCKCYNYTRYGYNIQAQVHVTFALYINYYMKGGG